MAFDLFVKRILLVIAALSCYYIGLSQTTIPEFKESLENTTSRRAKADICYEIASLYAKSLKIDSSLFYANKTKEYSSRENYELGMGKYYLVYAEAIYYRSRNAEAEDSLYKAIEIFNHNKDRAFLGLSYFLLANNEYVQKKIGSAKEKYWAAANLLESVHDDRVYFVYFWTARCYYKSFETDSASIYGIKALKIAEKVNKADRIFQSACWVGDLFWSIGDYDNAIKYFEEGLQNRKPTSDKISIRSFLSDYAICLVLKHEFSKADSAMEELELLNAKIKDAYGITITDWVKGASEYEKKNYETAVMYLRKANNKMNELNIHNNSDSRDILLILGKAEYETHDYDSSIDHLRSAIASSRKLRSQIDELEADLLISRSFQQKGDTDSAFRYFKYYSVLKDSIVSVQKQKSIIEITTKYETEKKEQVIRILEKEKEADVYALALKNQQIEKQQLENEKKSQQLLLLSQQSAISKLEASQKNLALENQRKDIIKKQKEFETIFKESQFRKTIAAKESQQKKIAYLAAVAVLIFAGIAFFRYRQSRKLSSQLSTSLVFLREAQDQLVKTEKEKEAENIRVRISRDIHDEVGATLSGVALFSEIAKQKMDQQQDADARVYLNQISTNSKEMVEKISDIVWAINPDNDSFERIISKLRAYSFNLCAGKGIQFHSSIDDTIQSHYPSMQVKRNLYLVMKEAINNAVKYSGARNIFLSIKASGPDIIAEIKDDGKGFDPSLTYTGNGLKNMKARADNLDAKFTVVSMNGKGTCISLQFHFHPIGGQMKAV